MGIPALRKGSVIRGSIVVFAVAAAGCGEAPSESRQPNFVILFADDLGYGDLGIYGHPTIRTPRLDEMARQGIKLTAFYTASASCSPSRAGLLTGRYPQRVGVPRVLTPDSPGGIDPAAVTLAEALKEQGYRTAAFGKWHLGSQPGYLPTDNGFDEYWGLLYSNDMIPPWVRTERPLQVYRGSEPTPEQPVEQTTLTRRTMDEAVAFIGRAGDEPFFLYISFSMPHLPISASDDFRGRSTGGRYGDTIEELDHSVGRILDALAKAGLDERTLVVFTSDNGPWSNMPPRMHSTEPVERWDAGTAGPLRGAKGTTWEGGHRVPCIVRWPGVFPPRQSSAELVTAMDFFPTLLRLAAAEPDPEALDGRDVLALLRGARESPHLRFFYVRGDFVEAVRDRTWKLRHDRERQVWELFNLREDPYERFDVAPDHADRVSAMREEMRAFAVELGGLV